MGKVITWEDIIFELKRKTEQRGYLTQKEKRWFTKIREWCQNAGYTV